MKKITNLTTQEILLEGFGFISITEGIDGKWSVDLFPRNSENNRDNILLETTFSTGDKYFERPKENRERIDDIYNTEEIEG